MYTSFVIVLISSCSMASSTPEFRVLAPQFICPTTDKAITSNQSYITIKSAEHLQLSWSVRWKPLPSPSQRFTIMLWKTIRELEKKLNGPQSEHFVYIIKDSELMSGVTYILNVTGASHDGNTTKSFSIDYSDGDQKLLDVEGRSDKLSLQLLGGQKTYADVEMIIEAQVTTCTHTQDYYFVWTVSDRKSNIVNVTERGQRLSLPPFVLQPGEEYTVRCEVIKMSNEKFITQSILPIQVLYRNLEVYISVDRLVTSIEKEFTLSSYISPKYEEQHLKIEWQCFYNNTECSYFGKSHSTSLYFSHGLPTTGEYLITLSVSDSQRTTVANATILAIEKNAPVIEVAPISHKVNEGSDVYVAANVSNLTPFCTLAWYVYEDMASNGTLEESPPGIIKSEVTTIYSLEQSFLNEIADYTNETEQREVVADMKAFSGRARIVANCSGADDDDDANYADISFEVNESPNIGDVVVTPDSGVALETLFRISTTEAMDEDKPVFYSFYCKLDGNDTVLMGSYMDHYAVETYLPYIKTNSTDVFVVTCDSLGACASSTTIAVHVRPPEGHMYVLEDLTAHVTRCEVIQLEKLAVFAFVTYNNANEMDKISALTENLLAILPNIQHRCVPGEQYEEILTKFTYVGIDVTSLLL